MVTKGKRMIEKYRSTHSGLLTLAVFTICALIFPLTTYAGNWMQVDNGWKYYTAEEAFLRSQWFQDDDGCWYYLDSEGNMMTDTVTPDGYSVGKDGAWLPKVAQIHRYTYITPDESCNHHAGTGSEPIFQVETSKPLVSLSFDSGSTLSYTDEILDILDKYNVRSTFFVTKEWAEAHENEVKKIHDRGHELGNHSASHPDMTELSAKQMSTQMKAAHNKIKELTGQDTFLFRAPYGAYNTSVIDTVKDNGYYCIQWTIDSLDWKNLGVRQIIDRVLYSGKLQNGAIILMHNGADYTPQALATVIEGIQSRGYEIVPVSELIYTRNYKIDNLGIQHSTALE